MTSLSERTFLLQKEWADLPLPVPIYRNVTKLPAVLRIPDRILLYIAPEENPLLWIFINASQVLLSLFLLIVLLSHLAINDDINNGGGGTLYEQDEENIALHFLGRFDVYNLITTSIWIVEVGTSLWLSSRNRDRLTCAQSIELCLALFIGGSSVYYVLPNHEPQIAAHHQNSGRIDDDRHSSNNTYVPASTIADSSTSIDLNIPFLLVNISVKTVAFSYGFILVLQRFRQRQEEEFQGAAWWDDISFSGTITSQFSNNTNARSQYKANMKQYERSQSQDSQTQCDNPLMTIYDRKQSAESAAESAITYDWNRI